MRLKLRLAMQERLRATTRRVGFDLVRDPPADLDPAAKSLIAAVRPYTMSSSERVATLRDSVRYIVRHEIAGAFVECGVWRGGSMMAIALVLLDEGVRDRDLYLFDTFEGMTPPTSEDVTSNGVTAAQMVAAFEGPEGNTMCRSPLDEVRANMSSTGYPMERVHFVRGRVEETLLDHSVGPIALLRLDTDWYESTAAEMKALYPQLVPRGVLTIDDYGFWQGSKRAVDEYFASDPLAPLLVRVDNTGRVAVKPSAVDP